MARTKHAWLLVAIAALPLSAHAADPASLAQCNADAAAAQRQRRAGKLLEARDWFRLCAREECPAQLASFCLDRLAETEGALPTLVIRARDPSGADIANLDVSIDGSSAGKTDGRAIAVDPGPRSIRVTGASTPSASTSIVVAEGEKLRPVIVPIALPTPDPKPAPRPTPRRPSFVPYVLAGIGVVSASVGGVLWASGLHDRSADLAAGGCAPNCSEHVKDSIHERLVAGDALVLLGLVSLGVGAYLFLRSPPHPTAEAR